MAEVITRFKLETTQFDSKLRDTAKALREISHQASLGGKDFDGFSKKAIESARALGTVQSGATNTKDKLKDLVGSYNDAAKAYNELTDKAKQGEFGKAMSQSLQQLQQEIKRTKDDLYSMGDATKSGGGGSKFTDMLSVAGGNLIAQGAMKLADELKATVQQGIELARAGEGIRVAFDKLDQPGLLANLREATHGTVADIELMKAAVKFNDFKLPLEELGTMLAFAQKKAKDTGQSVDYMVDSIVTGLGRKSLMILDNLGLSAAQIKERMKEGGDMTKAVGDIIREEMQKAGDYVETAADRANRAAAEAKNQMEELGRAAMPVAEEFDKAWNTIKIGSMQLLNTVLTPLANSLKYIQSVLGSNPKQLFENAWSKAGGEVGSNVDDKGNYIRRPAQKGATGFDWDKGTWKPGYTGAIYNRATGQTELPEINVTGHTPTKTPPPKKTTPTTTTNNAPTYAADSIAAQQAMVNELSKQWNEAGSEFRNDYLVQLIAAEEVLKRMKNEATLIRENSAGKLLGGDVETSGLGTVTGTNKTVNITGLDEETLKNAINLQNTGKSVADSWKDAASAVQSVGSALSGLDDPGAKIIGTIGQAIASIALGFAQATAADSKLGVFGWIAAIAGGMATMVSTIAAIHSATGYAEGGIIKGTTFSGDQIMANGGSIGLNAGELVLNRAQQSTLASQLQGQDKQMHVVGEVQGEKIILVANRTFRRKGQGEIVTW